MEPLTEHLPALAAQLGLGLGLAACAGLRAFLPLLVLGLAGRWGALPLAPRFEWLQTDQALVVFAVAVVVEILADKVPVVDHVLDVAGSFLKPVAGALLAAGVLAELPPVPAAVVALIGGGGIAAAIHMLKAKLRLLSSATTLGLANPVLSLLEDLAALAGSVVAVLVPLLLLALAGTALLLVLVWGARRHRPGPHSAA